MLVIGTLDFMRARYSYLSSPPLTVHVLCFHIWGLFLFNNTQIFSKLRLFIIYLEREFKWMRECGCIYLCTHTMVYMWTSEDKFQELVLFIHCVDSRIKIKSSVLVASTFTTEPSYCPKIWVFYLTIKLELAQISLSFCILKRLCCRPLSVIAGLCAHVSIV